jgi:hypothetical protein
MPKLLCLETNRGGGAPRNPANGFFFTWLIQRGRSFFIQESHHDSFVKGWRAWWSSFECDYAMLNQKIRILTAAL